MFRWDLKRDKELEQIRAVKVNLDSTNIGQDRRKMIGDRRSTIIIT